MDHPDDLFPGHLARARAGDPGGFDDLVRWIERPLLGFLRARRAAEPHEVANDVLVKVFQNLDGFEGNAAQFRAWVFRIARNRVIDEVRHRNRRPDLVLALDDVLDVLDPGHDPDIEQYDRIESLLAGLTDEQREIVVLRVVAGLSVEETAEVVGRRPGAVRALQHRGLNRLRRSFSGHP